MPDRLGNIFRLRQNIVVPESEHSEILTRKICIPTHVSWAVGVLRTIRLNDQSMLEIHEIHDVVINHDLTLELESRQTLVPQDCP